MPISNVKLSDGSRQDIIEYIASEKQKGTFKVIDVGGGVHSWCSSYLDALVDINTNMHCPMMVFNGDINEHHVWDNIISYVEKHGKFDFCVCTHTLEDIRNPFFVCNQMAMIAKAGYIAVPSKYLELARFENGPDGYRGHIHHRWIFDVRNDRLIGYPKLSFLESASFPDKIASTESGKKDLSLYWKDSIDLCLCNNDYMGPSVGAVVEYFHNLLD